MNELKSEDVMKALECFANGKRCEGEQCAYFKLRVGFCGSDLAKDALALLREKDALIAKHEAYIDTLNEDKSCLVEQIEKKDAEIERLKKDREELIVTLKMNDAPFPEGLQIVHDFCEKRKMEAITEFAERLKSEVNGGQFASYKGLEIRNVIDQIEKEMKEGKR